MVSLVDPSGRTDLDSHEPFMESKLSYRQVDGTEYSKTGQDSYESLIGQEGNQIKKYNIFIIY
jgi:hypothetical protein